MFNEFYKMSGSGNDFIMIDNRKDIVSNPAAAAKKLCPRGTSVGADGLILIENSNNYDFKMRIINADGSEAEMCGNGARCAVRFAELIGAINKDDTIFETIAGTINGSIINDEIKISLTVPEKVIIDQSLNIDGENIKYSFANTGVPHAVLIYDDVDKIDVYSLGKKIRFHKDFAPNGTNVNFISLVDEKTIKIRTYERGVENETLACGTGSTAAALISVLLGKTQSPVNVITKSGIILKVECNIQNNIIKNLYLQGEARFIYKGALMS